MVGHLYIGIFLRNIGCLPAITSFEIVSHGTFVMYNLVSGTALLMCWGWFVAARTYSLALVRSNRCPQEHNLVHNFCSFLLLAT